MFRSRTTLEVKNRYCLRCLCKIWIFSKGFDHLAFEINGLSDPPSKFHLLILELVTDREVDLPKSCISDLTAVTKQAREKRPFIQFSSLHEFKPWPPLIIKEWSPLTKKYLEKSVKFEKEFSPFCVFWAGSSHNCGAQCTLCWSSETSFRGWYYTCSLSWLMYTKSRCQSQRKTKFWEAKKSKRGVPEKDQ